MKRIRKRQIFASFKVFILLFVIISGNFSAFMVSAYHPKEISLWRHLAGENEMKASEAAIRRFNQSQNHWKVVPDYILENGYTQSMTTAARANILPCIIDIDQPMVPYFAWLGVLRPLDNLIDSQLTQKLNPSGKGFYRKKLYSVGQFDAALALFTRKSLLKQIHARVPTIDHPWNKTEFMSVLDKIKETGQYNYPLDIRAGNVDEWIPYAWAPWMISWGADLINRDNYHDVDGILNSEKAVSFGQWISTLVRNKYIPSEPGDGYGLVQGRIGIQYHGSWMSGEYSKALGNDLAILPVPDFGNGVVIGSGSWHWAITTNCSYPEGAKAFLSFLLSKQEIAAMSEATSLLPTSFEAAALTKNYSKNGQWRIFYRFSEQFSKPRPATPAYSVISSSYMKAMNDILNGSDPQTALDLAVENIEAAIERHNY